MPDSIYGKKKNKGEWAELYVLLELLGDGRLYASDSLLNKNETNYLNVLKIIREEKKTPLIDYVIKDDGMVQVVEHDTKEIIRSVPQRTFKMYAELLFSELQVKKGRAIEASKEICDFADAIGIKEPKAPAVKSLVKQFGGKNDIFIQVRDPQTSLVSLMGFSIKSKFASDPTLFNAGSSSQFLFRLNNGNDIIMEHFNDISDNGKRGWKICKQYLKNNNIDLEFIGTKNPVYNENMVLIRDSMPQIMAWAAKDRLIDSDGDYGVKETVGRMTLDNPLKVANPGIFYEKTIKDFLMAGFTGMTAAKIWDGKEQVNGGYIVVTNSGEVLCYHSVDREAFRDYLFNNTHFEYVATNKYCWSYIDKIKGEYILPLNVSIRFNKNLR